MNKKYQFLLLAVALCLQSFMQETPKYYAKVKKALLNTWDGKKVKDAKALKVDAVTGATFSSDAVIENVRLALDYYQNHK